jgi:hypothetical protein
MGAVKIAFLVPSLASNEAAKSGARFGPVRRQGDAHHCRLLDFGI